MTNRYLAVYSCDGGSKTGRQEFPNKRNAIAWAKRECKEHHTGAAERSFWRVMEQGIDRAGELYFVSACVESGTIN